MSMTDEYLTRLLPEGLRAIATERTDAVAINILTHAADALERIAPIRIDEIATALWPAPGSPESVSLWIAAAERCNGAAIVLTRLGEYRAAGDISTLGLVAVERANAMIERLHDR